MSNHLHGDIEKAKELILESKLSNFQIEEITGVSYSRVVMLRRELKQQPA